jgi:hypothetical protein
LSEFSALGAEKSDNATAGQIVERVRQALGRRRVVGDIRA